MAPLIFKTYRLTASTHPNYIRVEGLGNVKLRLIAMLNDTDAVLCTCEIIMHNDKLTTLETAAIFQLQQSIGAYYDVGWEGEIELGTDQDLRFLFTDTPTTAPTVGDVLHATVCYEMIEPQEWRSGREMRR